MGKLIKIIAAALVAIVVLLIALRLPWTKERMRSLVFEAAQKQGIFLTIDAIEGEPPFKWTFHNVHLQINSQESIDIEILRLRIAILPLFRGEFSISFLHADTATFLYIPSKTPMHLPSLAWPFSVKSLKIDALRLVDLSSRSEATFAIQGKGRIRRKARGFFCEAKVDSDHLSSQWKLEGSKKARHISCEAELDVRSRHAFEPLLTLPVETAFSASGRIHGPWKTWKNLFFPKSDEIYLKPLSAQLTGKLDKLEIAELRGLEQNASIDAAFDLYADTSLDVQSIVFKSPLLCLKGRGKTDASLTPQSLSLSVLIPHISRLLPFAGGIVSGEVNFDDHAFAATIASDRLEIGDLSFQGVRASTTLTPQDGTWIGSFSLEGSHPRLPFQLRGSASLRPRRELIVDNLELEMPAAAASGYLRVDIPSIQSTGSLVVQLFDLSQFGPLSGRLGLNLDLQGSDLRFFARAQNLQFQELLSKELTMEGSVANWIEAPKLSLSLEGSTVYLGPFFFDALSLSSRWGSGAWPYTISARGKWKESLEIASSGSWRLAKEALSATVETLHGQILQKSFSLQKPFSFHQTPTELLITECHMQLSHGYLLGKLELRPDFAKIDLKGEHFPIDFLALATPRFSLEGNSSLDVAIEGAPENLRGRINLLLEGADIMQAGKKVPIRSKGSLQVNLDRGIAQIHGDLVASSQQFVDLTASLPISYNLYPLQIGVDTAKPIACELTMEGHLEDLFDFINIGSQRATGLFSCRLLLSQKLSSPLLQGTIEWQEGSYENYFTGMAYEHIQAHGTAEGKLIRLHNLTAADAEGGKLSGAGTVVLNEKLPFSFDAAAGNLKILDLEWMTLFLTGPIRISGDTTEALAKGAVVVSRADISIPKELPVDLPILPVTFINEPAYLSTPIQTPEAAYPFHYDGILQAPKTIFLTGRGLDCELEGNLHVIGRNLTATATGSLRLVKGKFSFAGKQFTLTQGEMTFSPSAYLNLSGTLTLPDLTVTAILRGLLESPQLSFQSSPSLPTSSILARILFNKDVSELSATQALQLAETIVSLSGDSGPNVLETIRQSLGIDRLNITSGESDRVSVQIGKYLAQGVMITLSQSTESSQVIVEVELKGGFVLQAETQEDDQAKFSIKWNMNY